MRKLLGLGCVVAALLAVPALAHHSHAMFDYQRQSEVTGTVKIFKWTNPHSWLHMMAPDAKGQVVEYSIEMGTTGGLIRQGWRPNSVVPGDKVTVSIHPLKSGANGGEIRYIVLPSGKSLGEGHEDAEFPAGIPR
jgi:hypothetical protein